MKIIVLTAPTTMTAATPDSPTSVTTTIPLQKVGSGLQKTEAQKIKQAGIEQTQKKYAKFFVGSNIVDNAQDFPTFDREQLKIGGVLGKGLFGTVFEVTGVEIRNGPNDENWDAEQQFIADHCRREDNGDARYAIKVLSPEILNSTPKLFAQGTYDISIETRILSDIEHPNIVKARAFANVLPFHGHGFFIMMDRLYDTLQTRIAKWGKSQKRNSSFMRRSSKMFSRKREGATKIQDLLIKKITSAYDLSDALGYLHRRGIIYRDVKPENIGFDIRDDIKLFDFGLATEMKDDRKADDDTYRLTGTTGSPRYMSNEVGNEIPYNEKTDVYSFAILFWEMLSTKLPYDEYTMTALEDKVWNGAMERPVIDDIHCGGASETIQNMLREMWTPNFRDRPDFATVTELLRNELVQLRKGNDEGLEHTKRRSTFVFDGKQGGVDRKALMKMLSVSDLTTSIRKMGSND